MPAVILWQIDAVGLVISRYDDAADVECRVFAKVFLVHPQDIWRRCGVGFHVIVEGETVHVPQVPCLANAKDHRLYEAVEAPQQMLW